MILVFLSCLLLFNFWPAKKKDFQNIKVAAILWLAELLWKRKW